MKVANAIAEILKREGVEILIGYPVNPIIEAAAEADIRTVIVRQERTGLHMADAISRLSSGHNIGVFTMQHGPGSENAFGGVAQAYSESVPVLVLPAGYHKRIAHHFPNFNSTLNFQHITKSCEPLTSGKALADVMRRAYTQMRNGRPQPALVEIPLDVFAEEIDEVDYRPTKRHRVGPDPDDVVAAARALATAERPVLYVGQGVHYAQAWEEVRALAERLSLPVVTSIEGKSAFPENHSLSLGCGGRSTPRAVHEFLSNSDLIFGVGVSFGITAFGVFWPKYLRAGDKTIVHSTLDSLDLNKDVVADHAVLGDAKLVLQALLDELEGVRSTSAESRAVSVAGEIAAIKEEWLASWMPKLTSDATPLSPYRVLWDLKNTLDAKNTIITHDAGSPRDQLTPFWEATEPLSYLGWGKTTQLGYGLGLAMGAKLAQPDKVCVNVWGDAAIGFTGMDFETAARERIPILSILMNNFSMAIELPIMKVATEKYRSTDISGHYADFARSLGGYGERIENPAQIVPAIQRGLQANLDGKPALLEFLTAQEIEISSY